MKKVTIFLLTMIVALINPNLHSQEISLLSWNVFAIPKPFNWNGQATRAKLIGDVLKNSNFDVIVFQEAFANSLRKQIYKRIKANFPYQTDSFKLQRLPIILSSGVWIVSKLPLKLKDYVYFNDCVNADCFASKAAVLVEIDVAPKKKVQILGTHLRAWSGEKNIASRKKQIIQISDLLQKNIEPGIPQIIMGDFNVDTYSSNEYSSMIKTLDAIDFPLSGNLKYSIGDQKNKYTLKTDKNQLVDYIMLKRDDQTELEFKSKKIISLKSFDEKKNKPIDLSDHDAIHAIFSFPIEYKVQE